MNLISTIYITAYIMAIITNVTPSLGTFYYPWTGGNPQISPNDTWKYWKDDGHNPPITWASNYLPDFDYGYNPYNELYSSKSDYTIKKQLILMKRGCIQFVISSWWGRDTYTDKSLDIIFKILSEINSDIKFTIYYEKEGYGNISKDEIITDINYIKNKYANTPYYLKINGRPVIFVYNAGSLTKQKYIREAQKWSDIRNETGIYLILKVFSGYQDVYYLADSWHQYAPAKNFEKQGNYSAFISPGFHKYHNSPRLARENFTRFENDVIALKSANVKFKLIETWNEWGEGTGIEPAQKINHDDANGFTLATESYGTRYIDILNKYFCN